MPLTKSEIEKLEPGSALWDAGRGAVAGFGVRRQKGTPVFVLKYRFQGKARWFTIGKFGSPWTVDNARAEARRLLGIVAGGADPADQREKAKAERDVPTIADLCDRYMDAARKGLILTRFRRPKKASTLEIDEGRISRHIKPLIGDMKIADLDAKAVRRLIQDITAGKTAADEKTVKRGRAIVTGGEGTASRVADLLSGIMAWAVEEEYVVTNPVHGVRRYRGEPKERHLSAQELAALGRVLDEQATGPRATAIAIIRLLALTGCRLGEISNLKWSEFDEADRCLRLEDTKTGRSMRAIGSVPTALLASWPRVVGSPWVFPARSGDGPYLHTKKLVKEIFAAAGITDASSHTLRHTFASIASELGYSDATIAGLLGHKGRGVTSRYVHRPDAALAAAAEVVSRRVSETMNVPHQRAGWHRGPSHLLSTRDRAPRQSALASKVAPQEPE